MDTSSLLQWSIAETKNFLRLPRLSSGHWVGYINTLYEFIQGSGVNYLPLIVYLLLIHVNN